MSKAPAKKKTTTDGSTDSSEAAAAIGGTKTEAPAVMELAESDENEKLENRNVFKRIWLKMGEQVGTVRVSEYPDVYLAAVKAADEHRRDVITIGQTLINCCQADPSKQPDMLNDKPLESLPNEDPQEALATTLAQFGDAKFDSPQVVTAMRDATLKMAAAQRKLQAHCRTAIAGMRTYLVVDCEAFDVERKKLMKMRQHMDHSRHEYTSNATDARRLKFERDEQRFKEQMQLIIKSLENIPAMRDAMLASARSVLNAMHAYHKSCAAASKTLRPFRDLMGPPTPYDQL